MKITVLVPTYRRTSDLARCLDALARQRRAPDEVLVVDQLPHTATGKISKLTLRQQYQDYRLPESTDL